jgi:hypothetical protein
VTDWLLSKGLRSSCLIVCALFTSTSADKEGGEWRIPVKKFREVQQKVETKSFPGKGAVASQSIDRYSLTFTV